MVSRRLFGRRTAWAELIAAATLLLFSCSHHTAVVLAADDEECTLECGDHGECHKPVNKRSDNWAILLPESAFEDFCHCDDGWSGPKCSRSYDWCPDGVRKCYNGSTCKEREGVLRDGESPWECDCGVMEGSIVYAGFECDMAATVICESGNPSSIVSFCTNEGECGDPHADCDCPDEFEGPHCEYLKGTAPLKADKLENQPSNSGGDDKGLGGALIALIIITSALVVIGIIAVARRRMKDKIRGEEVSENSQVGMTEVSDESPTPQEQTDAEII